MTSAAPQQSFGFSDAIAASGCTESALTHLLRTGTVAADLAQAGGPGRHRRFSLTNLYEIALATVLATVTTLQSANPKIPGWQIKVTLGGLRDMWPVIQDLTTRPEREILALRFLSREAIAEFDRLNSPLMEGACNLIAYPVSRERAAKYLAERDDQFQAHTFIDLGAIVDAVNTRLNDGK
ncbi:MAG TPA: hypothetical protein VNJ03_16955 [Vicinamibacterales bacterium]|nr:hypothetical protein [Vicinamibacterales bacterium]